MIVTGHLGPTIYCKNKFLLTARRFPRPGCGFGNSLANDGGGGGPGGGGGGGGGGGPNIDDFKMVIPPSQCDPLFEECS